MTEYQGGGGNFLRNYAAASVGEYEKVTWYYQLS